MTIFFAKDTEMDNRWGLWLPTTHQEARVPSAFDKANLSKQVQLYAKKVSDSIEFPAINNYLQLWEQFKMLVTLGRS